MAIDIGRIAYQAYAEGVDNISYHGNALPKWEELGKISQDAWRHAAVAVSQYLDKSRKNMEDPEVVE